MAKQNPTGGEQAVSLDLPAPQLLAVSALLTDWLAGVREDLEQPERLKDPGRNRREAGAYERLLIGLTVGQMFVPDEEARAFLKQAADAFDRDSEFTVLLAEHDAIHALLARLGPPAESEAGEGS